jgi:hypothetical protein
MPSSPPPPPRAASQGLSPPGGSGPGGPRAARLQVTTVGPLLLMRFPAIVDSSVIGDMLAAFERAHTRGERFATVLDATETRRLPGAKDRERLAEWLHDESRQRLERQLNLGAAVVVTSGLVRAFIAAIYFVRKPQTPQHWAASLKEGLEWTCARLVHAGVALTPEVERMLVEVAVG